MYAKLINPKQHGKVSYNNTGSVARLSNYLAQEKGGKGKDVTYFGATFDALEKEELNHLIDTNVKGLREKDAKFYSLVLSPSADELTHIGDSEQALKAYTRQVMERYANNFQLKDGRVLESKDLVWGATIHHERHYRGTDKEVKDGKVTAGDKREGLQTHVHIVVSARDAEQQITLNPGGRSSRFSLIRWQTETGMQFQEQFGYTEKLQQYRKQEMRDQQREAFIETQRATKIGERVTKLNLLLPTEQHLDPVAVQKIAQIRKYDKTFYRMLNRVEGNAQEGKPIGDAYQLLSTGKKGEGEKMGRERLNTQNALLSATKSLGKLLQTSGRGRGVQDIGEKKGRRSGEIDIEM